MGDTSKAASTSSTPGAENNPDNIKISAEDKPDASDLGASELLPKLLEYFNNNHEELARAVGVQREIVETWFDGTGSPNESTVLRMRRIVQERRIE